MSIFENNKKQKKSKKSNVGKAPLSPDIQRMLDLLSSAKAQNGTDSQAQDEPVAGKSAPQEFTDSSQSSSAEKASQGKNAELSTQEIPKSNFPKPLSKNQIPSEAPSVTVSRQNAEGKEESVSLVAIRSTLDRKSDKDLIKPFRKFFNRVDEISTVMTRPSIHNLLYVICFNADSGMPYLQIKRLQVRKDGSVVELDLKPSSRVFDQSNVLETEIQFLWKILPGRNDGKELSLSEYTTFYRIWIALGRAILSTKRTYLQNYRSIPLIEFGALRATQFDWSIDNSAVRLTVSIAGGDGHRPMHALLSQDM